MARKVIFSKVYTTGENIVASASSDEVYVTDSEQYTKAPFDIISITNSDTVNLRINLNGNSGNTVEVPTNSIVSLDEQNINTFTITNTSTTTDHTAGTVRVLIQKTIEAGNGG